MLNKEQLKEIKEQLLEQINKNFPEDRRKDLISQINSMNDEELEVFLKQNNLIKDDLESKTEQKCIFCSIVAKEIPSQQIGENKSSIAVLEINPVSKGHSLIIPREHITSSDKLPKEAFELAEKISKKIKSKLKPREVTITSFNLFGHEVIAVIPVYTNETLSSKKIPTKPEDLEKLKKQLEDKPKKPRAKKEKKTKDIEDKKLWLPVRIP